MSKVSILFVWEKLFCEIWYIEILGLREFVRLMIVFLIKISWLICKIVDIVSKSRIILISWAHFRFIYSFDLCGLRFFPT